MNRITKMKESVDIEYKDQIALLKMSLCSLIESTKAKIADSKSRIFKQQELLSTTAETLEETHDNIVNDIQDIKIQLNNTQIQAKDIRDIVYQSELSQQTLNYEIMSIQKLCSSLKEECQKSEQRVVVAQEDVNERINQMRQLYEEVMNRYNSVQSQYDSNLSILEEQEMEILKLSRALKISQQHSKTAMEAFSELNDI